MSKIDQKYINNLQKFTDALEGIVEQLQAQAKAGTSDPVNEMLGNIPEKLDEIIKNQVKIKETTNAIKKDTREILSEIKNIRKSEKTGGLSSITETDNKKKTISAVKSIILIAGGILAIGMAFKIIGNVDLASVIALSIGILVAVEAFKRISEMNIGVTDMIFAGLMIVMMAGALVASSWILSLIAPMSIQQGITLLLIAGAVGVATWLILKGVDEINITKDWATILLLPLLLPLVATGLLLSSYILQYVQPISWKQALAIAIVGAAIGIATMFIGLAMIGMKKMSIKDALLLPIMIPLIAGGIVLASLIFQMFEPVTSPGDLLLGSLVIGLSLLLFLPTMLIVGKFVGKNWQAAVTGVVAIPLIALGITGAAWAFSLLPSELRYPTLEWSLGSAIGMLLFLPTMLIVGAIGMTGIGIAGLAIGLVGLPLIALSMVAVSHILREGDWSTNYPSLEWATGVGLSLILFGIATVLAAPAALVSGLFSFFGGEDPLVKLARSMLLVSEILQEGNWKTGYPTEEWANGVGGAIMMFAKAFAAVSMVEGIGSLFGKKLDFNSFVVTAAGSMLIAAAILAARKDWTTGYPTEEWSDGVGTALWMFAKAFATISLIEGIGSLFGGDIDFNQFVITAAGSMVIASHILQLGIWESGFPTKDWAEGVGLALSSFANAFAIVSAVEGLGSIVNKLFGGKEFNFNDFVVEAAGSMVVASHILALGNWDAKYPKKEYVEGFGGLLTIMAEAYKNINAVGFMDILGSIFGTGGKKMELSEFIIGSATSLALSSIILNTGKYEKIPDKKYMSDFSDFLQSFETAIKAFNDSNQEERMRKFKIFLTDILPAFANMAYVPPMDPFVQNMDKFTEVIDRIPVDKHKAIRDLSESLRDFSGALKDVDMSTLEKLETISQGMMIVSIIDETKLRGVLDAMSEKEAELKEIYGDKEKEGALTKLGNWASGILGGGGDEEEEKSSTAVVKDETDLDREAFYTNIAQIRGMLQQMMDLMDSPGQSGSFNK